MPHLNKYFSNEDRLALKMAIQKWNNICMGCAKDGGSDDCALCSIYTEQNSCGRCPIKQFTGSPGCLPYYTRWCDSWNNVSPEFFWKITTPEAAEAAAEAAESMLNMLYELEEAIDKIMEDYYAKK